MTDMHDLVAPYALDALDPDELAAFEAHLESCSRCRQELTELQEGVLSLAESVTVRPPSPLKEAVMAEIEADEIATVTPITSRRLGASWLLAGAAAAVALVFFGLWMSTSSRLDEVNQLAAVYEAADSVIVEVETEVGQARFTYSPSLGIGVFNGAALAELDESDVYQLWLIDPDGPDSAGTLVAGEADVVVEAAQPGLILAMTVEPSPGVDAPTSDPLFAAEL